MLTGMLGCRMPKDIRRAREDFNKLMNQFNQNSTVLDEFRPSNRTKRDTLSLPMGSAPLPYYQMECSGHGNSPTKVPVARERKMSFTATSGEFLAAFHEEDEKVGPRSKMAAGGLGAAGTGSPHEQQQRTVQPSDGAVPCSTEDRLLEYAAPSWHQQLEEGSAFAHRPDYADSSHGNVMESQLALEAGNRSLPSKPDQRRTIMQKRTGKGRSKKNPNLQSRISLDNFGGQMRPQQCPKQRFRGVLGRPGEEHHPRPSRGTRGPAEEGLGGGGDDDDDNAGAQPPQLPPPPPPLPAAAPTGCFDSEYRAQFTWRPPPPPRGGGAWAGPRGVREGGGGGDELAASLERDSLEEGGGRRSGARAQSSCRAAPRPSRPPPPALLSSSMERDSLGGGRVQPALDSGKAIYEPGGTESQLGNDSSKFSEKPSYDGSPFHATKEHTPRHSSGIDEEGGSGPGTAAEEGRGVPSPPASPPPAPPHREEEGGRGNKGETGRRRRRRGGGGGPRGGREGAAGGGGGLGVPAAAAAAAACPHARLRRSGHCLACRPRAVRGPDVLAEKGLWSRLHKNSPRQRKEECPRETQLQDQAVIKNVSTNLNHLEDQGKRLWNQAERKKKNHSYSVAVPLGGDSFRTDPKCSQVFFHPRLPLRSTLGDRRASEYARSYAWPPPLLS